MHDHEGWIMLKWYFSPCQQYLNTVCVFVCAVLDVGEVLRVRPLVSWGEPLSCASFSSTCRSRFQAIESDTPSQLTPSALTERRVSFWIALTTTKAACACAGANDFCGDSPLPRYCIVHEYVRFFDLRHKIQQLFTLNFSLTLPIFCQKIKF